MAIKQLTEFQHMQSKPEMYIGSTQTPIHLLYELIDNAADECINGKANKIIVTLNYDKFQYGVADNGRGIAISSPNIEGECPIVIATTLYSGGKFDNDLYSYHSGLHGVGLAVVNALSDEMTIIVKKDKDHHRRYDFFNSSNQDIHPTDIEKCGFSTKVMFKPSAKYFDTCEIERDIIVNRLKGILASSDKALEIKLEIIKDKKHQFVEIKNDIIQNYMNSCKCFECELTGSREDSDGKKILDKIAIYIGFSTESKTSKFFSIVNTLPIIDGNHKRFIESTLKEFIFEYAEKMKRHIQKEDALLGSNILAITSLSDPAFTGQTKQSLAGKIGKYSHIFVKEKLITALKGREGFFNEWIDYSENFRMNLDSKTKLKVKKTNSRVAVEDLKDCTSPKVSERELYLLEGRSAGGTLLQARDVKIHAILPLRGKILNVLNADFSKILNSKTLACIFNSIGIKPNVEDVSSIRYGKIIIMCDADADGYHISALLLSFFNKFCSKLIEEGRLFVARMPLFGCVINKKFIPIYTEEDHQKYLKMKNVVIHRYKGLGEMDPEELAPCAFDTSTRKLIQVTKAPDGSIDEIWNNKEEIVKDYVQR